jgi:ubiquitin C-terminal hydrolase
MKQNKKMKLFYKAVMENETKLIQLTAKFPNETIFDKYCQYYKNKNSNTIINKLNEMNLGYVKEMKKDDNCIFTNEFLNLKYLIENIRNNSINFQNIRANFMRLDNISSLPYLNAVIQNLVNIPALTTYLMDESNFDIINRNKNFCYFTCFICRILSNLYYEKNITSFNLEDLNEYIYLRESKFKFDENCIPGDLIKYILETINQEFGQLITNLTQNNNAFYSTIISNTFLCVSGNVIKCISCQNQKTEYNNSFLFEFYLDIIYNRYIDTKYISKKNDGKFVLKLELCFEYYFNESYYLALDDCFCNSCKKNTEHKIKNYLFSLPNIIIISVNKESDINNEIVLSFPEELNLKKFINNKSKIINYKYNLIGAISHKENRKKYYAFCKHNISNKWYKCCDLNIDECSNPINEILNQNVDVLIYESFGGSTGSINIQDIIDEKNNTMMSSSSNNSINSMNNDDDNREKIHI